MTVRFRAILVSSLMAVAIAIAPMAASSQTPAKVTKATTKVAKTTSKAANTASKKADANAAALAATVTCTDGTMSKGGQGACSSHGGVKTSAQVKAVANKIAASPAASPKAVAKAAPKSAVALADDANGVAAGALAKCKDGAYSHAKNRTGACSRHGGVASWM